MMRLGIGSYTYPWAVGVPGFTPPEQPIRPAMLLERAAALGVRVVQIADNLPLHLLSESEFDALRGQAIERGIELEVGTAGLQREHLLHYLEIAARLAARLVRTISDLPAHEPTCEEAIGLLASVAPEFERRGVTLGLENHDRFDSATLRRIIDRVDSPRVGICLDTANSFGCSEGPDRVLDVLGPVTVCLHAKDYTVNRLAHRFGFRIEGCPAGRGELNLPRWLDRLRELGRDVNVILELWPPPESTPSATIDKEARWARESVNYLRGFIPD